MAAIQLTMALKDYSSFGLKLALEFKELFFPSP
jgi:hypothetical protein